MVGCCCCCVSSCARVCPLMHCWCVCVCPGAGGLGDTTLHHVYADSTATGELTAAMKAGQHPAAAAGGGSGNAGMRGGNRRRSSVGRRARASLAAEPIPEEAAVTPQPSNAEQARQQQHQEEEEQEAAAAAVAEAEGAGAGSPQQQQLEDTTAPLDSTTPQAAAAADAAGDVTQDMDVSMTLGGTTPAAATPMVQQQEQQQHHLEPFPESPELGAFVNGSRDDMDVDGDENAPPASPPAAAAGGGGAGGAAAADLDGLTTHLLMDDNRQQLPGWGHVPLAGAHTERASLGASGGGGLTTHTGRGSVGSNVLTMHSVGQRITTARTAHRVV